MHNQSNQHNRHHNKCTELVSGWGLYPKVETELLDFNSAEHLLTLIDTGESVITRGMGRSYGDSALSKQRIISTQKFNRMLSFNYETGILSCQSGLTIAEILRCFVKRGWFIPVTPGTKFVSIGGAIASDVHGKNHHKDGSFSMCVKQFRLLTANGQIHTCSRTENPDLFQATFGGMGLTGVILDAEIRLKPISSAYILQKTIKCPDLESVMQNFERYRNWTYSVAWIDCLAHGKKLGRSLLMLGEHAEQMNLPPHLANRAFILDDKKKLSVPFFFPSITLNKYSISAFNELYYAKGCNNLYSHVDYDSFFYPLDSLHHWNRIYGKLGFIQYQCVLPMQHSYQGMSELLKKIAASGSGSFLAVLKQFGPQNGLLSFPIPGYTLALDFPLRDNLFPLLEQLDDITRHYGGRIYLSKDARMSKELFHATYQPALQKFTDLLKKIDPEKKFQSLQSKRLGI